MVSCRSVLCLKVIWLHLVINHRTQIIGLPLINNLSYVFKMPVICCHRSHRLIGVLAYLIKGGLIYWLNFS